MPRSPLTPNAAHCPCRGTQCNSLCRQSPHQQLVPHFRHPGRDQSPHVCRPGYSKTVRHTPGKVKTAVYRAYGLDRTESHFEIDHLISLELGGADLQANLWPQSYDTRPWGAHEKDALENRLQAMVCAGELPLEQAQKEIAADWIAAYERYVGEPASL
jgi:hypothetical protein